MGTVYLIIQSSASANSRVSVSRPRLYFAFLL